MKLITVLPCLLLTTILSASAQARSVTFFSDGAMVELELTTAKGIVDIDLPAGMTDGSLRIKGESETTIQRVDILPALPEKDTGEKEIDSLIEQRSRLNDRLQALATREEIFTTAAKSQSGKAPRKTKTNPDPMQSIRQGTDFAIAQLEAVYTARRKTEQEIRRIDNRIAAAKSGNRGTGTIARVLVSPAKGKVAVRYALFQQGWTPRYDIRFNGDGIVVVDLSGLLPSAFSGYSIKASPAQLADSASAKVFPAQTGSVARLASFRFPVTEELFRSGVQTSFSCLLNNTSPGHLAAGDASIYRKNEYVGRFRFEGISSGRIKRISMGTN
jgi:hypothetical protein